MTTGFVLNVLKIMKRGDEMNLNKTLCKYFDYSDKGYVTIGNVWDRISKYLIILITGLIIGIASIYTIIQGILFTLHIIKYCDIPPITYRPIDDINCLVGFFGMMMLIIIFVVILIALITTYISKIKIAKCELKDKDVSK